MLLLVRAHLVLRLTSQDTAALAVRVWREPGVAGFRGRVSYVVAARTGETVVAVDSAELVHSTVQRWLDEFGSTPYGAG